MEPVLTDDHQKEPLLSRIEGIWDMWGIPIASLVAALVASLFVVFAILVKFGVVN